MLFFVTVFLLGVSPWPICFSIILGILLTTNNYDYKIATRKTLFYHIGYLAMMLGIGFYIFGIRLARKDLSLDIVQLWEHLEFFWLMVYTTLPKSLILLFIVLALIYLVFILLLFLFLILYLKRTALSLYLYLRYYKAFKKFCRRSLDFEINYWFFLTTIVEKYTNNLTILGIASFIWPDSHIIIEKLLFRFLLPYLFLFDCYIHDGVISKVFFVLPWYYIYSIIRVSKFIFDEFAIIENFELSQIWYGNEIVDNTYF